MSSVDGNQQPAERGQISRRTLLQGAGAAGLSVVGAGLLAACGGSSTSSNASTGAATSAAGKPKKGGHITVALGGGANTDVPDPNYPGAAADSLLVEVVWDQLTQVNNNFELEMWLAESVEPTTAKCMEWTIRLRPDIHFQDGAPLTADDVIYTLQRILNPKNAFYGLSQIGPVDPKSVRKLDNLTVRLNMTRPFSVFDYTLGDGGVMGIVPVGFTRKKPIGTGAFRITEFVPERIVQLERNPYYWGGPTGNKNMPYLDSISCQIINDDTARINALLTGQVQVISEVPFAEIALVQQHANLELLESRNSAAVYYGMNCNDSPFTDVRVRQAMKYALNRPQIVQDAVSGHGFAGNDLFSPFDPDFDHALTRTHDPEKARSLLKQAGHLNAPVQITVGPVAPGAVQAATVMAENANQAGFKMTVDSVDYGTVVGPNFMHWPFSVDQLPGLTYLTSASLASIKGASIGIAHWNNAQFTNLYFQATATHDPSLRKEIIHKMQEIEFAQSGNLIPYFANTIDAHSTQVQGWPKQDLTGMGLGRGRWDQIYLV